MAKLVIVESPTKIKSVKKYLGAGYEVIPLEIVWKIITTMSTECNN